MPCFHPIEAGVVTECAVPCGRCIGCRLERSRQWAVRCMHEASLSDRNCFVTLTYEDDRLPLPYWKVHPETGELMRSGSLVKADFQRFIKRLRRRFSDDRIRYYHCGEYGDNLGRPHYHGLLFGFDFQDKEPWVVRKELPVWRSNSLEEVWDFGQSEIGSVTFESAAYVARYCTKVVNGPRAKDHYEVADVVSGEVQSLQPEYSTMSRRPGIGAGWFAKFRSDVYPSDQVVSRGFPGKPPRYYDTLLEREDSQMLEEVKFGRFRHRSDEDSPERLAVREDCALARFRLFSRSLENA